jgi:hypothetical protein
MLTRIPIEELELAAGGQSSFTPYGGYAAWQTSRRADEYRDFRRLQAEGKVKAGRNGEWGSQYAAYYNHLTAGSRVTSEVGARGSREDNLPRRT